MRPVNINPPYLLADGMDVGCKFHFGMEACETVATTALTKEDYSFWKKWLEFFPKSPMYVQAPYSNGLTYLCDTHYILISECIEQAKELTI